MIGAALRSCSGLTGKNNTLGRIMRHALANLRTHFEDTNATQPLFLADRSTIQFNEKSDHECDVTAFIADVTASVLKGGNNGNSAVAAHHWGQAVGRYRAPFLEGFGLPDCPAFEVWLLSMQERLIAIYRLHAIV